MAAGQNGLRPARGLLFDKDGTLFDFQSTWAGWASELVLQLAGGVVPVADDLAKRILLDRVGQRFHADSPAVAGTVDDIVAALLPGLPGVSRQMLAETIVRESHGVVPVEAVPLAPLLERLRRAGYALGVATNDAESAARTHLQGAGILHQFDVVIGADSGHGAKPAPGQCLAFSELVGVAAARTVMIGDSSHDLRAGKAAGMATVGVLTGTATRADLAPLADVVLADIGHLTEWLGLD